MSPNPSGFRELIKTETQQTIFVAQATNDTPTEKWLVVYTSMFKSEPGSNLTRTARATS